MFPIKGYCFGKYVMVCESRDHNHNDWNVVTAFNVNNWNVGDREPV